MSTELHPAAASAVGSTRLEGGEIDDATIELVDRVARGELSGDDAIAIARRGPVIVGRPSSAT